MIRINICIIFMILSILFWATTISAQDTSDTENQPALGSAEQTDQEKLYQHLDQTYMDCDNLEKRENLLTELRKHLTENPNDFGLLWRTARIIWFIGDWLEDDQSNRLREIGLEGMKYADQALQIKPSSLEAHYYKALTISTYSRGISIVKALLKGLGGDYEKNIQWVLEKDKTFDRGGPLRAMGRYYWKLPWPKYDYKKSLSFLEQAKQVDSSVLRTYYFFGDTYWALDRHEDARKAFEYVINTTPGPEDVKDAVWLKKKAQERLNKLLKEEF